MRHHARQRHHFLHPFVRTKGGQKIAVELGDAAKAAKAVREQHKHAEFLFRGGSPAEIRICRFA